MVATEYRRTPLPERAKTPLVWVMLCFMGLIFSPFVGFAIDGKVATPGILYGLVFATVPVLGLAAMAVKRWLAWRQLPAHIAQEWTSGRVVPPEGAPVVVAPVRFSNGKHRIEMATEGLTIFRSSLLSMQGVPQTMAKLWVADTTGEMFLPWDDIAEWGVDDDSDGPDYYLLRMRPGGLVRIRRFLPDHACECGLLDAVRSVGKVPIRLRCDLD